MVTCSIIDISRYLVTGVQEQKVALSRQHNELSEEIKNVEQTTQQPSKLLGSLFPGWGYPQS